MFGYVVLNALCVTVGAVVVHLIWKESTSQYKKGYDAGYQRRVDEEQIVKDVEDKMKHEQPFISQCTSFITEKAVR